MKKEKILNKYLFLMIFLVCFDFTNQSLIEKQKVVKNINERKLKYPEKKAKVSAQTMCGCGNVPGALQYYEYHSSVAYYRYLQDQITYYLNFWANDILEHSEENAFGVSPNLVKISKLNVKLIEENEISLKSKEFKKINLENPNYKKQKGLSLKYTPKPNGNDDVTKIKTKLDSGLEAFENNPELEKRFNLIRFLYYKKFNQCIEKDPSPIINFSKCLKDDKREAIIFEYLVNLTYDGPQGEDSVIYKILIKFKPMAKNGKYSFTYHPFFYLGSDDKASFDGTGLVFSKVLSDMVNSKNPEKEYKNKFIIITYDGFHYDPGRSEPRTSCRHALATLRLSIQMLIQMRYTSSFKMDYCPKVTQMPNCEKNFEIMFTPEWFLNCYDVFLKLIIRTRSNQPKPPLKNEDPIDQPVVEDKPIEDIPKDDPIPEKVDPPKKKKKKIPIPKREKPVIHEDPDDEPKEKEKEKPSLPRIKITIKDVPQPIPLKTKPPMDSGVRAKIQGNTEVPFNLIQDFNEDFDPPQDLVGIEINIDWDCETFMKARQNRYFLGENLKILDGLDQIPNVLFLCDEKSINDPNPEGKIFFLKMEVGNLRFFMPPDDQIKYCFEIEVNINQNSINRMACINKMTFQVNEMSDPDQANETAYDFHYKLLLNQLADTLTNINEINTSWIETEHIYNYIIKEFEIDSIANPGNKITFDYTFKSSYTLQDLERISLDNLSGVSMTLKLSDYPECFFNVNIYEADDYIKLIFDIGPRYLEFYYPRKMNLNMNKIRDIMESNANKITPEMNDEDLVKIDFSNMGVKAFEEMIKIYLQEMFLQDIKDMFLIKILGKDRSNEEISIIDYGVLPPQLKKYLGTELMNLTVLAGFFNFLMMKNFEFDRVDFSYKKSMLGEEHANIDIFDLQAKAQGYIEAEELTDEAIEELTNFWNLFEIFEVFEEDNVFGIDNLEGWLYSSDGDWNLGIFKDVIMLSNIRELEGLKFDIFDKILNFDTFYLNEKYKLNRNNYASFLYGKNEYQRIMIVQMWFYDDFPFKGFHIKFQNQFFINEFILSLSSYEETLIHMNSIIKEVDIHLKELVYQNQETPDDCVDFSFFKIKKVLIEVLESLNLSSVDSEIAPNVSICEDKDSFNSGIGIDEMVKSEEDDSDKTFIKFYARRVSQTEDSDLKYKACTADLKELKPALYISNEINIEGKKLINIKIFDTKNMKNVEKILSEKDENNHEKPGRNFYSEYRFFKNICFDYDPILKRYLNSSLKHFFKGEFSEETFRSEPKPPKKKEEEKTDGDQNGETQINDDNTVVEDDNTVVKNAETIIKDDETGGE